MLIQFVFIISEINNNNTVYMDYGYILIIIKITKLQKKELKKKKHLKYNYLTKHINLLL